MVTIAVRLDTVPKFNLDSRPHKAHINLYGLFILGVNIKYRLFCTSLPPYGGYTGERVKSQE